MTRHSIAGLATECWPIHVIEYQGGAHFKGAHATAARDAVKKEALRRAGIGYVEVVCWRHAGGAQAGGGEVGAGDLVHLVNCHRNLTVISSSERAITDPGETWND